MRNKYYASPSKVRGVSLVESMVAMIVLSIGMLGIAALYVESLRANRTALTRTQAVTLASDMADRIRANSAAGAAYAKTVDAAGTSSAACNGGTGTCTVADMAANDIAVWYGLVDDRGDNPAIGRLAPPGGRGTIAVTGTSPVTFTITVSWSEPGQGTNSYVLRAQI